MSENDTGYEVRAEVAGAKKEDIHVSIDGNFVLISAEVLAHEVDEKAAIAKYEDGVLKLSLPRKQEASSRTLTIQ